MSRIASALERSALLANLHEGAARLFAGMEGVEAYAASKPEELTEVYREAFRRARQLAAQASCEQCKPHEVDHDMCRRAFYLFTGAVACRLDRLDSGRNPQLSVALWAELRLGLDDREAERLRRWFDYGDHGAEDAPITIKPSPQEVFIPPDPYAVPTIGTSAQAAAGQLDI